MGASLSYSDFINWLPTAWAWIVILLIDLEVVLEVSPPVDPVNTSAVGFDPKFKGISDGFQKPGSILQVEGFTGLKGVDTGSK